MQVWDSLFGEGLGPAPEELYAPCCAEFMVSRERIRRHPRAFYEHLRTWILDTELDMYRSGRVFEYVWHYMFGEPAVMEPAPECELLVCENHPAPVEEQPPAENKAPNEDTVHAEEGASVKKNAPAKESKAHAERSSHLEKGALAQKSAHNVTVVEVAAARDTISALIGDMA